MVMLRRIVIPLLALQMLAGCAMETKVIRRKEWFAGLPGVEGGTGTVVASDAPANTAGAFRGSSLAEDKLREVTPASPTAKPTTKLISQTGRHLMIHIYETLRDNERELFAEQVLSERTRQEFAERGFPATDAFDLLKAQEEQVVAFLQAVPDAELTPGARVSPLGNRVQRVMAGPNTQASQSLSIGLIGMDMVMEKGQWRLRWFVPGPGYEMPRILEPWEQEALRNQQIARGQTPDGSRMLVPNDERNKPKPGINTGLDALNESTTDSAGDSLEQASTPTPRGSPEPSAQTAQPRPLPPPR